MELLSFSNLFIISVIALIAPVLVAFTPRLMIPGVVVEILAGIIVGPSVLGWVEVDLPVEVLSVLGLSFLAFLAGLEIDVQGIRGRLLTLSLVGFVISLALGFGLGAVFDGLGWGGTPLLFAVILSATALGLVVPVLKDAGQVTSVVGQTVLASATVADFGALLLLSVLFTASGSSTGSRIVLLGGFVTLVVATGLVLSQARRLPRIGDLVVSLQDTTAAIRIRASVVLLVGFAALAGLFGLESILGAFFAGAIVATLDRDTTTHPHYRTKLEAIGYGFLIPVFFVSSGVSLDLAGLVDNPSNLLQVPVFFLALLLVRGVPALLFLPTFGRTGTAATALLQATSLPFIVAAAQIGEAVGLLDPITGAALVSAGLLSVLLFPASALSLLNRMGRPASEPDEAEPTSDPPAGQPMERPSRESESM
jgi:Kef-type K+ transport system membrane component KefB